MELSNYKKGAAEAVPEESYLLKGRKPGHGGVSDSRQIYEKFLESLIFSAWIGLIPALAP